MLTDPSSQASEPAASSEPDIATSGQGRDEPGKPERQVAVGLFSRAFYRLCHFTGRVILRVFFGFDVTGLENIPAEGGVLLASNHRSHADPVLVGLVIKRPLHFMAKKELFRNRLFGWFIRSLHAFPMSRSVADRSSLQRAVALLKSGRALLMFPEGTRSLTDDFLPPKPGIGLISVKSGVPIVPTYVHDSWKILEPGSAVVKVHKLHMSFGRPIEPPQLVDEPDSGLYLRIAEDVLQAIGNLRTELVSRLDEGSSTPSSRSD